MKESDVRDFLQMVGAEKISDKVNAKGWLHSTCPFAKWKHSDGKDSQPSFAILVVDDGQSAYNCLACGEKGKGLQGMVWKIKSLGGGGQSAATEFVRSHELIPKKADRNVAASILKRKAREAALYQFRAEMTEDTQGSLLGSSFDVSRELMDDTSLDEFIKAYHPYMRERGFTKEACKAWGLCIDHRKHGDMIVFPIRDIDGNLLAFSRRMTWDVPTCTYCGYDGDDQKWGLRPNKSGEGGCPNCGKFVSPKYMHSTGFQRNLYLYGEHMVDRTHRKGVVVEGNLDPIRLWQCGVKNGVATLGSNPGTGRPDPVRGLPGQQLYRIEQLFDEIIMLADGDKAGAGWASQIERYFEKRWLAVHVIHCPKGLDPGNLDREDLKRLIGHFDVWM